MPFCGMSASSQIIDLRKLKHKGEIKETDSSNGAEVSYGMLNVTKLPFSHTR